MGTAIILAVINHAIQSTLNYLCVDWRRYNGITDLLNSAMTVTLLCVFSYDIIVLSMNTCDRLKLAKFTKSFNIPRFVCCELFAPSEPDPNCVALHMNCNQLRSETILVAIILVVIFLHRAPLLVSDVVTSNTRPDLAISVFSRHSVVPMKIFPP